MNRDECVTRRDEALAEARQLLDDNPHGLDATASARFAELEGEAQRLAQRIDQLDALTRAAGIPANLTPGSHPGFNHSRTPEPPPPADAAALVRMGAGEVRDLALRLVEQPAASRLAPEHQDHFDELVRSDNDDLDGTYVARRALITETPAYRSAWAQVVTQDHPLLNSEEIAALRAFRDLERFENRAAAVGTGSAGGYGVPVFIDPTIIHTGQGSTTPWRELASWKPTTSNVWKGVTSAGIVWSFDAEASQVSDDAPTLVQPSIDVHMARGFVPYSIEVGMDYPGFAEEMAKLLGAGYEEYVTERLTLGTGTAEPWGIVAALDANTNVEVAVTTDGSLGYEDVNKLWKALPQRFRANASWMMSVGVNNQVQSFGDDKLARQTVSLAGGWVDRIKARPAYENPYMADFTGSTAAVNLLIVGDFRQYVVAERIGMNIELVNHLFSTSNGRPTGQRGWFAWARLGADSVYDSAFRLLQNP